MDASKVSQQPNKDHSLALETAWQHFAEFDYNANLASKQYLRLRHWIIILGAATTLLALLTESYHELRDLFDRLGFRSKYIEPSIKLFTDELNKLKEEKAANYQGNHDDMQVFLFSGHMIDEPNRTEPRFPPEMESEAIEKIEGILNEFKAEGNDLAIAAGAACGGDILFIEAALRRNMKIEVLLPFTEAGFIQTL